MSEGFRASLFFIEIVKMRLLRIAYFTIASLGFLIMGCRTEDNMAQKASQMLKDLKENQAKVIISIDGKEFYPDSSVFSGQMLLTDQMLSLAVTDQFDGKTMLNFGGDEWYGKSPVSKEVDLKDAFNASLKLGKMVDTKNMIGEGYMMSEGKIEAVTFELDRMVFSISGKAAKYSDFGTPEKYLPLEGFIVYKMPAISWSNITEDEVFSATKLDK